MASTVYETELHRRWDTSKTIFEHHGKCFPSSRKTKFLLVSHFNRPFPSCILHLSQNESSCETIHMKTCPPTGSFSCESNSLPYEDFARRFDLTQRHSVTQKWPILLAMSRTSLLLCQYVTRCIAQYAHKTSWCRLSGNFRRISPRPETKTMKDPVNYLNNFIIIGKSGQNE